MKKLITEIFPFADWESDGTRTLREAMYQAPFVWYSNVPGADSGGFQVIQDWHIKPFLEDYPEQADTTIPPASGEFAVMRLPEEYPLQDLAHRTAKFDRVLQRETGWRLATVEYAPLFAETQQNPFFGEECGYARYLWCLGSPVSTHAWKRQVRMHRVPVPVPTVSFPLISRQRSYLPDGSKIHGWEVETQHTVWTRDLAKPRRGQKYPAGIPLLLVRG